ncbi:6457_t:CDS:2 [Ambispora gerdemannii]|uniref:6457_t:CDS:1 n=1 Tax=Ambispora gerdemannii TaxID=144530 RepID=A0A9N9B134_9GLOM|nr:6457_t:CDS:2 [Ambispora gerdemannii]
MCFKFLIRRTVKTTKEENTEATNPTENTEATNPTEITTRVMSLDEKLDELDRCKSQLTITEYQKTRQAILDNFSRGKEGA